MVTVSQDALLQTALGDIQRLGPACVLVLSTLNLLLEHLKLLWETCTTTNS